MQVHKNNHVNFEYPNCREWITFKNNHVIDHYRYQDLAYLMPIS